MWLRLVGAGLIGFVLACVALTFLTTGDEVADWEPAASALMPRFEGPGVVVGGKVYFFGGFNDEGFAEGRLNAVRVVETYDPAADRWERLGEAPTALTHIVPAADGPHVWIAGGFIGDYPGAASAAVWRYDTRDDSWSERPSLPVPLGGGGLVRVGRKLHYFGGYYAAEEPEGADHHWALDLDDEAAGWQPRAKLPETRGHAGSTVFEGRIYVFGGTHVHHPIPEDIASNVRYDPARDRWEHFAPLPAPRSHIEPGTLVVGDRILLVGGRDNASGYFDETAMADLLAYEPATDTFHPLPHLPRALRAPVAFLWKDELFVTMGSTYGADHAQATTWRTPCLPDAPSLCNPESASAGVRRAATARNLLKRFARATPWPFGRLWEPLRATAIPYYRDPVILD